MSTVVYDGAKRFYFKYQFYIKIKNVNLASFNGKNLNSSLSITEISTTKYQGHY